ncbi:hypothetical protein [Nocardia cyriacigeorgica]|uniref:hypothetical protein n=1 Tax=Nocardia cyriacigeorgica TaxID=135487 RepID=UPI00245658B0|nr:hypothetical protein [Nocardia cyriacigeorgica]
MISEVDRAEPESQDIRNVAQDASAVRRASDPGGAERSGGPAGAHPMTGGHRGATPPQHPDQRRSRSRRASFGAAAIAGAALLAGCDSASGIPGDDPSGSNSITATTPPAAIPDRTPPATTPAAPPIPADAPPVGAVPGVPEAAPAVQRWAVDLESKTIAQLQTTCWTLPPLTVADMYADPQPVLAALARPGTVTDDVITWRSSAGTTVTVDRAAVASGYACPRVFPAGAEPGYDDADARHTVRRYLARLIGKPLDPSDQEGTHPLICTANPANWDPQGTGSPLPAPLANNPGRLTGTTAFADQQISSQALRAGYVAVQVPVTNSSGVTQTRTFTLREGSDGYCIGDVSP